MRSTFTPPSNCCDGRVCPPRASLPAFLLFASGLQACSVLRATPQARWPRHCAGPLAFAPCAILEIQPQKAPGMFAYSQNDYYCERVPLADLAHRVGTPAYVYSSQAIRQNYAAYTQAFGTLPHTVCYAVKANSSLAVLALLAKEGAGFDIVSGGELYRVLAAGGDPAKIVFSGVGKTAAEVEYALESGIHSFNCESEAEL